MPHPIDEVTFAQRVLGPDCTVIVDFAAPWCGPCVQLDRVLDQLADRYRGRVEVVSVNIEAEPDLAQRYGVRSVPTLLAFRGGTVVGQQVGFSRASRVEELFAELDAASGHASLR